VLWFFPFPLLEPSLICAPRWPGQVLDQRIFLCFRGAVRNESSCIRPFPTVDRRQLGFLTLPQSVELLSELHCDALIVPRDSRSVLVPNRIVAPHANLFSSSFAPFSSTSCHGPRNLRQTSVQPDSVVHLSLPSFDMYTRWDMSPPSRQYVRPSPARGARTFPTS